MKVGQVYSGNYLKAEDLQGKTVRVTINHVAVEEFENNNKVERKIVLGFQGKDKMFILNKTNAAIITENLGTDESDSWMGQTIALAVKKVEYAGKLVPAIRVVLNENPPAAPAKKAPASPPTAPIETEEQFDDDPNSTPF